jgi:hypothetical protein
MTDLARQKARDNITMNHMTLAKIVELEERLEGAMLTSDVTVLDELIADDLIFTSHDGRVFSKQEDLDVHKSGLLKLNALSSSDRTIRELGRVAVVTVRVQLAGHHGDSHFEGAFRYTRIWAQQGARWQIVVAHASAVTG